MSELLSAISIVRVDPDLGSATQFFRKCFLHEYHQMLDDTVNTFIETEAAESILSHDLIGRELRSAWLGKKLIGTVVGVQRERFFFVWGMYVDPNYFRKGIGTRLLECICGDLPNGTIISVQVIDESIGALRFYTNMGFEPVASEEVEVFPNVFRSAKILNCRIEYLKRSLIE